MASAAYVPFSAPRILHIRHREFFTFGISRWLSGPEICRRARLLSRLEEPLTGKMWSLEDFEAYPALLKGLAVVAISSNSIITHPQDGPKFMAEEAKAFGYPFPYLYDESQDVARDFGAVCTLEFFLFKKDGRRPFELVYHGQFDDSRPCKMCRSQEGT